jgi:peptidoglycan/LPS O-acetylase OafA/YrhL
MSQILGIQILRALAALMVVFAHAQDDALNQATKSGGGFARFHALPWDTGVDLFFVISGFIMVHSSRRLFATNGAARTFIARRITRIVPLYWLITSLTLLGCAYAAWEGHRAFPHLDEIMASYGFVPFARPEDGQPRPLMSLGWTLNYEMFFYAIFALFIFLHRDRAIIAVTLSLLLCVALGALFKPSQTALAYWSDPIVLEFVFGALLALAYEQGWRLTRSAVPALIMVGLSILAFDLGGMARMGPFDVEHNGFLRLFACGLPMALIFLAVALADPAMSGRGRVFSFLVLLGDASYALYLFHPLAVIFGRKAYLALGLEHAFGFWPLVIAEIPLAVILALAVHIWVEKPLSRRLHHMLRIGGGKSEAETPKSTPLTIEGK